MQKSYRFMLTILILGSYLLSACTGAVPQGSDPSGDAGVNSNEVTNMNDSSSDDGENSNDSQGNDNDDNGKPFKKVSPLGKLDAPLGVAVDADGFVYVTDSDNYRVQKFTSDGEFVAAWGK